MRGSSRKPVSSSTEPGSSRGRGVPCSRVVLSPQCCIPCRACAHAARSLSNKSSKLARRRYEKNGFGDASVFARLHGLYSESVRLRQAASDMAREPSKAATLGGSFAAFRETIDGREILFALEDAELVMYRLQQALTVAADGVQGLRDRLDEGHAHENGDSGGGAADAETHLAADRLRRQIEAGDAEVQGLRDDERAAQRRCRKLREDACAAFIAAAARKVSMMAFELLRLGKAVVGDVYAAECGALASERRREATREKWRMFSLLNTQEDGFLDESDVRALIERLGADLSLADTAAILALKDDSGLVCVDSVVQRMFPNLQ